MEIVVGEETSNVDREDTSTTNIEPDTNIKDTEPPTHFNKRSMNHDDIFMKVCLITPTPLGSTMTEKRLKSVIYGMLKVAFGIVGTSFLVDVIKYKQKKQIATLRFKNSGYVVVWSTLSMVTSCDNQPCSILELKTTQSLSSLAVCCRNFNVDKYKQIL